VYSLREFGTAAEPQQALQDEKHLDANYVQHELFELLLPANSAP
jgi:ABC-type metal ion transport system substrate-binding protein